MLEERVAVIALEATIDDLSSRVARTIKISLNFKFYMIMESKEALFPIK